MKTENNDKKNMKNKDTKGYPSYPKSEDIYQQHEAEEEIDPNDPAEEKDETDSNAKRQLPLDKLVEKDNLKAKVEGLDIPGENLEETDDAMGDVDEENQYYSLGGERHEGLEESEDDVIDDE